jgi:4'-phosphopantetheinyl transferase
MMTAVSRTALPPAPGPFVVADDQWHTPAGPALVEGEVHVWRIALDRPTWDDADLRSSLAPDELARAARFVFPVDRERFVAARDALRQILARYIGCSPRQVHFGYSQHGKPTLRAPGASTGLTFNLSHTRDLALCAVTRGREVGIDVEAIRPEVAIDEIARTTFSPAERSALAALPPGERLAAFFACWTRKEAYLKARGDGLTYPLDQFDVSLGPGEAPALLGSREGPAEVRRWDLRALDLGERYAAALAVARPAGRVRLLTIG